jgi:hypothetical protein
LPVFERIFPDAAKAGVGLISDAAKVVSVRSSGETLWQDAEENPAAAQIKPKPNSFREC